ncbi:carbohydrate ABC transporter permease [Naasia aerilata]|uniref:Sugar ABC transporter permease n=1 Tax=Naasia aerilata TaxID=1162966 RepID=A0ABN6XK02_9MICO|nr:hypothetical protein [Naasia aerilata]BDZ45146.1 hypothetical protein GCM10025866_10550 [Naasia aerilata]
MTAPPVPGALITRSTSSASDRGARRDTGAAWLMLAPAVVLLAWWFVAPIVQSVLLSFQQVSKFDFGRRSVVGLDNYAQLFGDPAFLRSLGITGTFVLGVVPAQTLLALLVAAALHGVRRGGASCAPHTSSRT